MSDNNSFFNLIPDSIDKAAGNLSDPLTKKVGETLGDIWEILFGGRLAYYRDKKRIERADDLMKFQEGLRHKIEKIPEDKLLEPNSQIIMSAMSDAQFAIEKDNLREMFENLIASSLNSDTANRIHPSFSGILRRMSPLDAQNIQLFQKVFKKPIAEYKLSTADLQSITVKSHVFLENPQMQDIDMQSASISFLQSMGLLSVSYSNVHTNKAHYNRHESTELFTAFSQTIADFNKTSNHQLKIVLLSMNDQVELPGNQKTFLEMPEPFSDVALNSVRTELAKGFAIFTHAKVVHGSVTLTPLGRHFLSVCS